MKIVLASGSPRRKEILSNLGLEFEVVTSDIDENIGITRPHSLVCELSMQKAKDVAAKLKHPKDTLIIAADTVVFNNGEILGKPKDRAEAEKMLCSLSNSQHRVITGIALIYGEKTNFASCSTTVCFDYIKQSELVSYLNSDEPYDKAGAYAIQGKASLWIKSINGCYFNVVGFPVNLFKNMLSEMNINLF